MKDFDIEQQAEHSIPLWRIALSIFSLAILLLFSTVLVCGTNEACRSRLPTLNNLLDSSFVSPFIVSALNSILSLHLFVSVGIYYLTMEKAYVVCRVQMAASILVYISIVITLFVFPITTWDRNVANLTIIAAFAFWMICVILCLRKYYKYKAYYKRNLVNVQLVIAGTYCASSLGYVLIRFIFTSYPGYLLIFEIFSGLCIMAFLGISIVHICGMSVIVRV